jgi:hypothetical protein
MKSVEPRRRLAARALACWAVQLSCHISPAASSSGNCLIERDFWGGGLREGWVALEDECQQSKLRVSPLAHFLMH